MEGTDPPIALSVLDTRGRYGAAVAVLSLGVGAERSGSKKGPLGIRNVPWTIRRH